MNVEARQPTLAVKRQLEFAFRPPVDKWRGMNPDGRLIIVEGMDNSGKTTLIQQLKAARPQAEIRKLTTGGAPTQEMVEAYCDELIDRAEDGVDTIFDRHSMVSERVYGPVLRPGRQSMLPLWKWHSTLSWLKGLNVTLVYCRPPRESILDFGERWQMEGVRERGEQLLRAYDDFFLSDAEEMRPSLRHLTAYDWTQDPNAEAFIAGLRAGGHW